MRKNSKNPEVRKQELIDVATKLFMKKGYGSVSVRDILDEVNGAQGMFYYYFKSKQDIYIQAMEQYIDKMLFEKSKVINNTELNFIEKRTLLRKMIYENLNDYIHGFGPEDNASVENTAYKVNYFVEMINKLHLLISKFIMQGIEEGYISSDVYINEKSVNKYSLFLVYGIWGTLYNSYFTNSKEKFDSGDLISIIEKLFYKKTI
ncbi:TetR/AcrR family transcriptional regulator [Clostridium felsineum]|uniref:TetR/AcrR family transcriptional regulator n=1 Tax=Clostridium felsineum TaxID=36839 RepID=UPI00214DCB90|nr:TetR/AcrR family transcriptional regulator [Clostridium felsineum]MCR3758268.1 TetR/AcrR family transcriptional regulator [Clostridium felsineum]